MNVSPTAARTTLASCFLALTPCEIDACPISTPAPTALVDTGRSSIDADLQVWVQGEGEDASCGALLSVPLSKVPSRSQVPRPRELASELIPVARSYGAKVCHVMVLVEDDGDAPEADSDLCWTGSYRYDGDFWRVETEDAPCW